MEKASPRALLKAGTLTDDGVELEAAFLTLIGGKFELEEENGSITGGGKTMPVILPLLLLPIFPLAFEEEIWEVLLKRVTMINYYQTKVVFYEILIGAHLVGART